jgi:hypothetical protein
MSSPYSLEPELLAGTPRKVVAVSWTSSLGIGCLRLFILPFILVGFGLLLAVVGTVSLATFHAETRGVVTHKETEDDEDGPSYRIAYRYDVGGREYHARDTIPADAYVAITEGADVPVAYLPGFAGLYSIALPGGRTILQTLPFLVPFCAFWNGIVSVFVWLAYVAPVRQKWLYRWGAVTQGMIVRKQTSTSDDSTTYRLYYEFPDPEFLGRTRHGNELMTEEQYLQAQEGDSLTILYNPRRPKQNTAYSYGGYRVVESDWS